MRLFEINALLSQTVITLSERVSPIKGVTSSLLGVINKLKKIETTGVRYIEKEGTRLTHVMDYVALDLKKMGFADLAKDASIARNSISSAITLSQVQSSRIGKGWSDARNQAQTLYRKIKRL